MNSFLLKAANEEKTKCILTVGMHDQKRERKNDETLNILYNYGLMFTGVTLFMCHFVIKGALVEF